MICYVLLGYVIVVMVLLGNEVVRCLRSALCRKGLEHRKLPYKYDIMIAVFWLPLLLLLAYVRIRDYLHDLLKGK